jgi:serine protease inhibitor
MQRRAARARLIGMGSGIRITAGVAAAVITAAGCGPAVAARPQPTAVSRGVAASDLAVTPRALGAADTAFGLDVLGAWCRQDPDANIVLSPESLATGLGMAYLGARGSTARAMRAVLHLADGGAGLGAALHARSAALRDLDGPGVTVSGSDRVWANPRMQPLPSYTRAVAAGYAATVGRAPLLTDPAAAARQIDASIAAATRGHIPQLLGPGSLRGIGWVLTDALYLDADWAAPFPASQTRPGQFTTATGRQVRAEFLHGGAFRSVSAGGWTAVSLPYRGGKLAMTALLPDSGSGGCPALSAHTLSGIAAALAMPRTGGGLTGIALPRVSLRSSASLGNLLAGLGMGVAFSGGANFTGLSPQACCIGLVQHAATLAVAAKGTVGSAATAAGIAPTAISVPPTSLAFDRPYVLLVTDTQTGEPLLAARVADAAV